MTDNQLIDIILLDLYDKSNPAGASLKMGILEPRNLNPDKEQINRVLTKLKSGLVDQKESIVANDPRLVITDRGIEIIEKFGDYSSFLESEQKDQIKETRQSKVNVILKIISTLGIIWGAVFTILTFMKDSKIERLETQNKTLAEQVDSLKKEIKTRANNKQSQSSASSPLDHDTVKR
ncbi:MAG: hypothetical protein RLP14_03215 [Owenweeksia sp.]